MAVLLLRELRMELRSIRRASSAHVVASHSYCMKAGGPKMVFSAGADGLQVAAASASDDLPCCRDADAAPGS